ncbi:MAG: aminotransferase class V-fold PLP-dependent enzyme [Candidatus Wallbacteria bacterium]|nr:aminotransferase class V-fold PLP-dependent enzyme [Candidatus Wallbacteria bacterium]
MSHKIIYLDNNATTPIHPEVKKAIIKAMSLYGNASSLHELGRTSRAAIEASRANISGFLGASPEELIFVGTGSEANNGVLNNITCHGSCCSAKQGKRDEIITTVIEHPCVLEASKCLASKGLKVHFLKVDDRGKIDLNQLQKLLSEHTALVSVMSANNEIGTIQEIGEIARLAHKYGAYFHTDAVQAVGKIPLDVRKLEIDFLSFSAHKIYGPKGVGSLYIRKGIPYCPFIRGGHQEMGRRAGTENTIGILALSRAIDMRREEMDEEAIRLLSLKKALKYGLAEKIPDIRFNGDQDDTLPGTLNVSFMGAEGESILLYLDLEGICVSTGSACASGSLDPSHVLLALGLTHEWAHGSVRISLGRQTTESEIHRVLKVFPGIIEKIRRMSTTYKKK